eukprot:jgi/Mesen1/5453/ME000273S04689
MSSRGGRGGNLALALGLGVFALGGLAFPFLLRTSHPKPLVDWEKPLSPQAVQRGPYLNTGSRDIGPDPTPVEHYKRHNLSSSPSPDGDK